MSAKKTRLGRGLDALLETTVSAPDADGDERLLQLGVDQLRKGRYQPRTSMNDETLEALASSIKTRGLVQPLLVRATGDGSYEIVAGERRWRAAQLAGLDTVPALVRDINDDEAAALALIENIQREDLTAIEEASGLQRLLDEFGMTHQQVADAVGRSRTAVTNLLRLLALDTEVREHLQSGRIDMGHARALLSLSTGAQRAIATLVIERGLSVRETERLVEREKRQPGRARPAATKDADIRRLEEELSERLGAKLSIQDRKGKGRLVIHYHSLDELDGILKRIK